MENRKRKAKRVLYVVGSLVLFVGICAAMPELIKCGSDYLYSKSHKSIKLQGNDDWGPEIVKKKVNLGGSTNGEI